MAPTVAFSPPSWSPRLRSFPVNRAPLALLGLGLLATPARAAEVTDIPAELQGTADLTYSGFAEFGALEESGVVISQRRVLRNDLFYNVEFAPVDGIAIVLGLDQTAGVKYSYPNARQMLFEPSQGGGTYLLSEDEVGDTVNGAGLNGIWIGAAFSPFNERYKRGQRSTWRLDVGFRTGAASKNLWVAKNGNRGSAPGGSAIRLAGAVSRDMGTGNPWMKIDFVNENKLVTDIVDEDGNTWARGVTLKPASTLEISTGVEVVAVDDPAQDTRFAVDFFAGFGYRSPEEVSSGVYLPNVIETGRQVPMTVGDRTFAKAGIHADYHINEFVRARTGPDFRFHTPFFPEHAYDVVTRAAHLGVGWMFRIEGRLQPNTGNEMDLEGTAAERIETLD